MGLTRRSRRAGPMRPEHAGLDHGGPYPEAGDGADQEPGQEGQGHSFTVLKTASGLTLAAHACRTDQSRLVTDGACLAAGLTSS